MALYLVCYITIYNTCNDRLLNTVLLHRLMARVVALLLLAVFWHTWIMKLRQTMSYDQLKVSQHLIEQLNDFVVFEGRTISMFCPKWYKHRCEQLTPGSQTYSAALIIQVLFCSCLLFVQVQTTLNCSIPILNRDNLVFKKFCFIEFVKNIHIFGIFLNPQSWITWPSSLQGRHKYEIQISKS